MYNLSKIHLEELDKDKLILILTRFPVCQFTLKTSFKIKRAQFFLFIDNMIHAFIIKAEIIQF